MSATEAHAIVTGVDFVSIPTSDLERAVAFYGETLGLRRSAYRPERNFAEFEHRDRDAQRARPRAHGHRVAAAQREPAGAPRRRRGRRPRDARGARGGVRRDIFDTGACHMAFFADPDGNALMLHHRYAPRTPEG